MEATLVFGDRHRDFGSKHMFVAGGLWPPGSGLGDMSAVTTLRLALYFRINLAQHPGSVGAEVGALVQPAGSSSTRTQKTRVFGWGTMAG
eukprot:13218229-Alexandrium_andersonii.AAC.1